MRTEKSVNYLWIDKDKMEIKLTKGGKTENYKLQIQSPDITEFI